MVKISSSEIESFESWCVAEIKKTDRPSVHLPQLFNAEQDKMAKAGHVGKELLKLAAENTIEAFSQIDKTKLDTLNLDGDGKIHDFSFELNKFSESGNLTEITEPHIWSLSLQRLQKFQLTGGLIREITLSPGVKEILLRDCFIGRVAVPHDEEKNLTFENCFVGRLVLASRSLGTLSFDGGTIRSLTLPAPEDDYPCTGSVTFTEVEWPTSTKKSKLFQGPQQYRNFRAHLEKLQNSRETGLMRALELASERETDRGLEWLFSRLYGWISDYGRNPWLPLLWAIVIYLWFVIFVYFFDGGELGLAEDAYRGWRNNLAGQSLDAKLLRSFMLPGQSMANPLGIFGTRQLVVPATGFWQSLLSIQGVACDILFAASILSLRKRFRLR